MKDLKAFKKERNFLSHKGITYCLDYDGELSKAEVEEIQVRLEAIQKESTRLWLAIDDEGNNFHGHLWFEPVQ